MAEKTFGSAWRCAQAACLTVAFALAALFTGALAVPGQALAAVSVSNPRVVADSSMKAGQVSTWDCVWFGSYPQSEVTSADVVYSRLQSASWNANGDATVGGAKYRRISRDDATYSGYWESDAPTYRYFRYEPIKWRVLGVSGSTAFVVADAALDCQRYNANWTSVTWEMSGIRSWLNGYGASSNQPGTDFSSRSFVGAAFSAGEQAAILTADVANAGNLEYGTEGGNGTRDKVFLLSESEVYGDAAKSHGFAAGYGAYDEARRCKATDFANAMGSWRTTSGSYEGNCWWWLRSPGVYSGHASYVGNGGWVNRYGHDVDDYDYAVRPALNLNLASSYPTAAGTVSSNGTVSEQAATGQYGSGDGGNSGSGGSGSGSGSSGGESGSGTSAFVKTAGMALGKYASGNVSDSNVAKFFPVDFTAKQTVVPVEFTQETDPSDGSVTYKLGIGIGRKDLLDKKETWS